MIMNSYKHAKLNILDSSNKEYIKELSELFIITNPNALISIFGKRFVIDFVSNFYKSNDRNIFFYVYKNEVIGYVFFLNNINTIRNLDLNYFKIFFKLLSKPKIISNLLKNRNKNKLRNNFNNKTGYLMYLGIKKDFQGLGHGYDLVNSFIKFVPKNVEKIITDTKSKMVEKFFHKCKFKTIYSKNDSFYLLKFNLMKE